MIYVTHDQTEALALADRVAVLHHGRLQQIGAPAEVYEKPANAFVAAFLGWPGMWILDGRVTDRAHHLVLSVLDTWIEVPPNLAGARNWVKGKALRIGIRPEHVVIAPVSEAAPCIGERRTPGVVLMEVIRLEPLGPVQVVHLQCGPLRLIAFRPENVTLKEGDLVQVTLDQARLHWFDAETGWRVS
jgi:ABC-type sugar transport system ATPase subunit